MPFSRFCSAVVVSLLLAAPRPLAAQHVQPAPGPSGQAVAEAVPSAVAAAPAAAGPSPVARVLLESLAASVGVVVGGFAGGFVGVLATGEGGAAPAVGTVLGASLVGALGVDFVGTRLYGADGSFWASWGGAALGGSLGLGLGWLASSAMSSGDRTTVAVFVSWSLAALGAVLGFELTVPAADATGTTAGTEPGLAARARLAPWLTPDGRGGGLALFAAL